MRVAGSLAIAIAIVVCARIAMAQPVVTPAKIDLTKCNKAEQAAAPSTLPALTVAPNYKTYEITGELVDPPETVRALMDPTMHANPNLNNEARKAIADAAAKIGYELVGLTTTQLPDDTTKASVFLAPRPMVRKIDVNVHQGLVDALIDDEVRHHMQLHVGSYLPWKPLDRACARLDEQRNLEDFLRTSGYYDGKVEVTEDLDKGALKLNVDVQLGAEYHVGKITIADTGPLAVAPDKKITDIFTEHRRTCIVATLCFGSLRFTQKQHEEDKKKVVELFHKAGYPAVRVQTDVDYKTSFDRRTKTVPFTIRIDQRRRLDVVFEGNDPDAITDEQLRGQLTFAQAQSSDDVEAADSARAITKYLQGRGYFDAKVTWTRERFAIVDHLVYRIQAGNGREVKKIEFLGAKALSPEQLGELIATKPAKVTLFGDTVAATSEQLADDVGRIKDAYRRAGYRAARIRVSAATDPAGLTSAALAAALAAGARGDGLYVRFTIDEGAPTKLVGIEIANDDGDVTLAGTARADASKPDHRLTAELCRDSLRHLGELLGDPTLAQQQPKQRCVANTRGADPKQRNGEFREDDVAKTKDDMREWLFNTGRPRAEVDYKADVTAPDKITAHYQLGRLDILKFGKVIIRGNFRTRPSVILGELQFKEGSLLTSDALAEGVRRVRETGLFDAVNVDPLDLKTTSAGEVNAVVTVQERYDYLAAITTEVGYSSLNKLFGTLGWQQRNLFGIGMSFEPTFTLGTAIFSLEGTIRVPQWLSRPISPIEFTTEITAFYRDQDTPQFGPLTTEGVTVGLSRTFKRQHAAGQNARAVSVGLHYDYRLRERNVDVIRPIGADDDQTQVPIQTTTGSVGVTLDWDQRVDRTGALQQLAPDAGFRFSSQVSFASHYLLGQDTFIKASAGGTKYQSIGRNLLLRADFRYDEGFPLGGSVLLPEVERYFAGGDATVRGYDDDRLSTEIITVGVPPLGNLQQIRIVPSGGNIRLMGSLDAQVRIYKFLASGVFTDAGLITNQWSSVTSSDIRPSVGMALARIVTPFGSLAIEYAVPIHPHLGDDPRGRWHLTFAARAQF